MITLSTATKERRLDRYYQRKFGWSLAEVDRMLAAQGNACAWCGRPPGKMRLSVDHSHAYDRIRVTTHRLPGPVREYIAKADMFGTEISTRAATRKLAREIVRRILRRNSVRGALCLRCNKALALLEDSKAPRSPIERLEAAAQYLRKFQEKNR